MPLFNAYENEEGNFVPAIEESRLMELFQFGNPKYFHVSDDVTLDDNTTTPLEAVLSAVNSVSAKHFLANAPTTIQNIYFGAEEKGSFIMAARYKDMFRDENQDRFVLIIAHMHNDPEDKNSGSAAPFFVTSGYFVEDKETKKPSLVIQEAICRVRTTDNREVATHATNIESLMASFCYADEAFRAIAVGDSLDIEDFQSWIEQQNLPQVQERIEILANRDKAGLEDELRRGSVEAITRQADNGASFDQAIEKAVAGGAFYVSPHMTPRYN